MEKTEQKMAINNAGQVTTVYKKTSTALTCPVCGDEVPFLLGVDEEGATVGCEAHYKPSKTPPKATAEDITSTDQMADLKTSFPQEAQDGPQAPVVVSQSEKTQNLLNSLGVRQQ